MRRALLLLVMLACDRAEPSQAKPVNVALLGPDELAPDDQQVKVEVLDPGKEPRRALRLHPVVGSKDTLTIASDVQMNMMVAGQKAPFVGIPPTAITLESEVKAIRGDQIDLIVRVKDAKVTGDAGSSFVKVVGDELQDLKGKEGYETLTDRGDVKEWRGLTVSSSEGQFGGTMSEVLSYAGQSFVLPEEPVGVGARWRTHQVMSRNGITMDTIETYHLTALDGDRGRYEAEVAWTGERQRLLAAGLPVYVHMEVQSSQAKGTAAASFDLAHPGSGTFEMKMQAGMDMKMVADKHPIDMALSYEITVSAKPSSEPPAPR